MVKVTRYCPKCNKELKLHNIIRLKGTDIEIVGFHMFCPNSKCDFETKDQGNIKDFEKLILEG